MCSNRHVLLNNLIMFDYDYINDKSKKRFKKNAVWSDSNIVCHTLHNLSLLYFVLFWFVAEQSMQEIFHVSSFKAANILQPSIINHSIIVKYLEENTLHKKANQVCT